MEERQGRMAVPNETDVDAKEEGVEGRMDMHKEGPKGWESFKDVPWDIIVSLISKEDINTKNEGRGGQL